MAGIKLQTKGFEKAIKAIGRFPLEKAKEIQQELDMTALLVESEAKRRSPYDLGRLRASIVMQDMGPFRRSVGTNVEYAVHQEFGTRYMKAHPFLFPALESQRQRFLANLRKILNTT